MVHIQTEEMRNFKLEELWKDGEVINFQNYNLFAFLSYKSVEYCLKKLLFNFN